MKKGIPWVAIIIDLSTPVSNIITMIRKYKVDMDEMIYFALAKDLDDAMIAAESLTSFDATRSR